MGINFFHVGIVSSFVIICSVKLFGILLSASNVYSLV